MKITSFPLLNHETHNLIASILVICYCCVAVIYSSCLEAKLCCSGRDTSCVVQKSLTDNVIENVNDKQCYCDQACLNLGDCCTDFKQACRVADCLVSVWQNWSECNTKCGIGIMSRRRVILKQPINGGKHCPSLVQKRGCFGTQCPQNPRSALKEIAMLLPARRSNLSKPIYLMNEKRNISTIPLSIPENASTQYCVLFKVLRATKACKKEFTFSVLQEGEKVCVLCDNEAMQASLGYRCSGHGTMDRSTRWSSLTAPHCHGKWVRLDSSPQMLSKHWSICQVCPSGPQYVFV